jgi:hypothetical protein
MLLLTLVRQARRRLIGNDLLAQGANAFCAAMFAVILLLLLGTQILNWHWASLIPLGAAAFGLYRTWRRSPSAYIAAQTLDRRLQLADSLSTAYFFKDESQQQKVSATVREWQYRHAERLAAGVDVRAALPFRMPRAVYAMAALFLVATSLFALRYGLTHRLDLKPPLARILEQNLGGSDPVREAAAHRKSAPKAPDFQDEQSVPLSDQDLKQGDIDPAAANALEQSEVPEVDNSKATPSKTGAKTKGEEGDQIAGEDQEGQTEDAQSSSGENNGQGQQGENSPKDGQKSASDQQNGSAGENSSLMQKFKEAMQNLLSKMKQQPNGSSRQQSTEAAQSGKQGKQQQANGKQNAGQGQKQNGGQDADAQEGQPGDEAQSSQNSDAKGTGDSNDQQANKQPGSGIGKQDGSKDLKLAEQMAAMGKISELIGKRSANVTGEAMVEVENTSQQLTTRYEGRQATHGETGGEISRDEVPVALQGYVQLYFEQVRKQAPAKKAEGKQD